MFVILPKELKYAYGSNPSKEVGALLYRRFLIRSSDSLSLFVTVDYLYFFVQLVFMSDY